MRYVWDQWRFYAPDNRILRNLAGPLRRYLQDWDRESSQGSHLRLVANSHFVARRIQQVWQRQADVIHPPVDARFFIDASLHDREGWCVVSALVPYKRVELAVRWASSYQRRLVVVGEGPERQRLEAQAGPTVTFLGRVSREVIREVMSTSLGLIFPGVEDFGIVPLEAMATGTPVIAFGEGGALETVVERVDLKTGTFFHEDTPRALEEAAVRVEQGWCEEAYQRVEMQRWVEGFSTARFDQELRDACLSAASALGVQGLFDEG